VHELESKKSIRTIDVDEETIALLREQQERQRFDRRAWGTGYRADLGLVFCRPGGSAEDPNILQCPASSARELKRHRHAVRQCPPCARLSGNA
jgi:hypothetical protein